MVRIRIRLGNETVKRLLTRFYLVLASLAGSVVGLTEVGYADNLYCVTKQEVSTAHKHYRAR